jgi:hypothetical protein
MSTQSLIHELTGDRHPAIIYEDNFGAIYLVRNQQISSRKKPIDVCHHYLWDLHENRRLVARFKRSEDKSANIMTNNTPKVIHVQHMDMIHSGMLTCWREDVMSALSITLHGMSNVN